jgi:hypothetical protein
MYRRRGLAIVGLLVGLLLLAGVGLAAYQAGLAAHVPATAPPSGYYGYWGPWAWGWGFGFGALHFVGLLFFVLLLAFLFRFAFRPWGWGGRYRGGPPPFVSERFEDMHRRAHGEPPAEGPPAV